MLLLRRTTEILRCGVLTPSRLPVSTSDKLHVNSAAMTSRLWTAEEQQVMRLAHRSRGARQTGELKNIEVEHECFVHGEQPRWRWSEKFTPDRKSSQNSRMQGRQLGTQIGTVQSTVQATRKLFGKPKFVPALGEFHTRPWSKQSNQRPRSRYAILGSKYNFSKADQKDRPNRIELISHIKGSKTEARRSPSTNRVLGANTVSSKSSRSARGARCASGNTTVSSLPTRLSGIFAE